MNLFSCTEWRLFLLDVFAIQTCFDYRKKNSPLSEGLFMLSHTSYTANIFTYFMFIELLPLQMLLQGKSKVQYPQSQPLGYQERPQMWGAPPALPTLHPLSTSALCMEQKRLSRGKSTRMALGLTSSLLVCLEDGFYP